MASLNDSRDSRSSRGGDEVNEMFCESCKEFENQDETASVYCDTCNEYFCTKCGVYHRRYKSDHTMLNQEEMPQVFCQEFCPLHPNLLIKFYCEGHKTSGCKKCKKSNHSNCQEVKYIPNLVGDINQSNELQDIIQDLNHLLEDLKLMMDIMPSHKGINTTKEDAYQAMKKRREALQKQMEDQWNTTCQQLEEKAKAAIDNHETKHKKEIDDLEKQHQIKLEKLKSDYKDTKKEIDDSNKQEEESTLKKLADQHEKLRLKHAEEEKKLDNEIEKRSKNDKENMARISKQAKKVLNDVQSIESEIKGKMVRNQKCGLFLTMKHAAEKMEGLKYMANQVQAQNHVNNYIFESGENINPNTDFDVVDIAFGTLKEKSTEKRSLKAIAKVTIGKKGDCRISGLCQLSDFHLVAIGNSHCELILVDITDNIVTNNFPLGNNGSKPFDVTKIKENTVAVTFPQAGIIQFLTINVNGDDPKSTSEIKVGVGCHGILYRWGHLVVSYTENPRVEIMGLKGNVIRKFEKNEKGNALFESPLYVAQGLYDKTIYVSDYQKATVIRLSNSGNPQNNIEVSLKSVCSMGITIDLQGTVYVLDGGSIHQLSSDLSTSHHLKSHQDQQVNHLGLFYSISNNKLYEARWGILRIYEMS